MKTKQEIKKYFENGDKPTQEQFWEWQDSYWHKDEKLPVDSLDYDLANKADLVNGKVPASQLPSYIDDVLEFESLESLPNQGEKGKYTSRQILMHNTDGADLSTSKLIWIPI